MWRQIFQLFYYYHELKYMKTELISLPTGLELATPRKVCHLQRLVNCNLMMPTTNILEWIHCVHHQSSVWRWKRYTGIRLALQSDVFDTFLLLLSTFRTFFVQVPYCYFVEWSCHSLSSFDHLQSQWTILFELKGDAMNLTVNIKVLGPLMLSFWIFCIIYAKK